MKTPRFKPAHALFVLGIIALPHANRATQLELSTTRARQIESAYIVVDVAERFAEEHSGVYSSLVAGFQQYLPRGGLCMNPYTLARTEPVDGAAATPGQIGYVVISQGGINVGFTLNLFGRVGEIMSIVRYPGAQAVEGTAAPTADE